jgi:hypothetical protein
LYRASTIVAMIGLMVYRRSNYGGVQQSHLGSRVNEGIEADSAAGGRSEGPR